MKHVSVRGRIEGNSCRFLYEFTIKKKAGIREQLIGIPVPTSAIPLDFFTTTNNISKKGKPDFGDKQRCVYDDVLASGDCGILVSYGKDVGTQVLVGLLPDKKIKMGINFEMELTRTKTALNLIFPSLNCPGSRKHGYNVDFDIAKGGVKNVYSQNVNLESRDGYFKARWNKYSFQTPLEVIIEHESEDTEQKLNRCSHVLFFLNYSGTEDPGKMTNIYRQITNYMEKVHSYGISGSVITYGSTYCAIRDASNTKDLYISLMNLRRNYNGETISFSTARNRFMKSNPCIYPDDLLMIAAGFNIDNDVECMRKFRNLVCVDLFHRKETSNALLRTGIPFVDHIYWNSIARQWDNINKHKDCLNIDYTNRIPMTDGQIVVYESDSTETCDAFEMLGDVHICDNMRNRNIKNNDKSIYSVLKQKGIVASKNRRYMDSLSFEENSKHNKHKSVLLPDATDIAKLNTKLLSHIQSIKDWKEAVNEDNMKTILEVIREMYKDVNKSDIRRVMQTMKAKAAELKEIRNDNCASL